MVDEKTLVRGGIYLAKLNPAKTFEVGKVRPVIILNAQKILDISPPIVFICPLSSKSHSNFANPPKNRTSWQFRSRKFCSG